MSTRRCGKSSTRNKTVCVRVEYTYTVGERISSHCESGTSGGALMPTMPRDFGALTSVGVQITLTLARLDRDVVGSGFSPCFCRSPTKSTGGDATVHAPRQRDGRMHDGATESAGNVGAGSLSSRRQRRECGLKRQRRCSLRCLAPGCAGGTSTFSRLSPHVCHSKAPPRRGKTSLCCRTSELPFV